MNSVNKRALLFMLLLTISNLAFGGNYYIDFLSSKLSEQLPENFTSRASLKCAIAASWSLGSLALGGAALLSSFSTCPKNESQSYVTVGGTLYKTNLSKSTCYLIAGLSFLSAYKSANYAFQKFNK